MGPLNVSEPVSYKGPGLIPTLSSSTLCLSSPSKCTTTHAIQEDTLEELRKHLTFDLDDRAGGDSDLRDLWPAWTRVINLLAGGL